ncbi:hypothetical protein CBL_20403 [Carabus blaptoides fortunei]
MKNRGGFSDTTPPMNPEERPRRLVVATDPESFPCEADGCNKTFPTKRGLGVHQQKVHRDWYDAAQMARRPPKKSHGSSRAVQTCPLLEHSASIYCSLTKASASAVIE